MFLGIWKYVKKEWRLNTIVLLIDVVGATCTTLFGLGAANILTAVVKRQLSIVLIWFAILAATSLVWAVQIVSHERMLTSAIQKMDADIRDDMTERLIAAGYAGFHQHNPSVYISWMTNDIGTINDYGFFCLEMAALQAITIAMSIATIVHFHYSMIATIVVLLVIMYFVPKAFTKKMNQAALSATKTAETATKIISDFLSGFDDLLMLNLQKQITTAVNHASTTLREARVKQATANGTMMGASNLSSLLSQTVVRAQAVLLYLWKLAPIGGISAASYFSATIFSSTTGMLANLMEVKTTKPVFEKYMALIPEATIAPQDQIDITDQPAAIKFEHVDFRYESSLILDDCSFELPAGRKLILVGDSGTGKTTVLDLIAKKIRPTQGTLRYGSVAYNHIVATQLRDQLIYINQKPHLFNDTLRFNITLGSAIPDEDLLAAIEVSGLAPLIDNLSVGLETVISENGSDLSGGQVQRVALARGLAQKKHVWLIDEATSSLDPESTRDIEDRLMALDKVTMLVVSHHASERLRQQADQVVELVDGKVQSV